jgi:N-ethylmaleimide reductase
MRSDFMGQQSGDVINLAREHYQGNLIGNMGYSHQEADTAIREGQLNAVACGVPFIANPDLVSRFENNSVLNEADPNTFYTRGPEGYNDYPQLDQSELKGAENE